MNKFYTMLEERFNSEKDQGQAVQYNQEIFLTYLGLLVTCVATIFVTLELILHIGNGFAQLQYLSAVGTALFLFLILILVYGGIVYQLTRLAYLKRMKDHTPVSYEDLEKFSHRKMPQLTILVPSYKEEQRVVTMTLMSAALQTYPDKKVVLLIDDPPTGHLKDDADNLQQMRTLVDELNGLFRTMHRRFDLPYKNFIQRVQDGIFSLEPEIRVLADLYHQAALWHKDQAKLFQADNHSERFYVREILGQQFDQLMAKQKEVQAIPATPEAQSLIIHHYRILRSLFSVTLSSFERKRYENLSHAPNKAMNLNSYIGLMGNSYRERRVGRQLFLDQAEDFPDIKVPDTDYIITLDADSLIMPDYARRLVHFVEQPGNENIAVCQTPYSSFPGAVAGNLEYTAGATTDIQYLIHQGFTAYSATFWVGANALLKKKALLDIAENDTERGYQVRRFIQDRTVIEDTESSVDLIENNWSLHNYPARLSYSATPPDFGSLIIQRERWANGGLIILPKLLRYFFTGEKTGSKFLEAFMRVHYLFSIAAVNFSLVILLTFPLAEKVPVYWIPFTALFYFVNYARDLKMTGYRGSDIFRVYALNILLVPVNIAGVCRSLRQAWNRKKIPFGRTPKVDGRVSTPPAYLFAAYFLTSHWLIMSGYDLYRGHILHALFAGINGAFMLYAIVRFIGVHNTITDLKPYSRLIGSTIASLSRRVPTPSFHRGQITLMAIIVPPVTLIIWALEKIT